MGAAPMQVEIWFSTMRSAVVQTFHAARHWLRLNSGVSMPNDAGHEGRPAKKRTCAAMRPLQKALPLLAPPPAPPPGRRATGRVAASRRVSTRRPAAARGPTGRRRSARRASAERAAARTRRACAGADVLLAGAGDAGGCQATVRAHAAASAARGAARRGDALTARVTAPRRAGRGRARRPPSARRRGEEPEDETDQQDEREAHGHRLPHPRASATSLSGSVDGRTVTPGLEESGGDEAARDDVRTNRSRPRRRPRAWGAGTATRRLLAGRAPAR